jgi:gliding motility-associated-like protein
MLRKFYGFLITFFLLGTLQSHAQDYVGGDIEMTSLGGDSYKFTINLFIDDDSYNALNATDKANFDKFVQDYINATIYAKNGDVVKYSPLKLDASGTGVKLAIENEDCVTDKTKLKVTKYSFSATVSLPAAMYNDPKGYYIAWSDAFRPFFAVANTYTPVNLQSGFTQYLEFPSLTAYPNYSSPKFKFTKNKAICVNEPFEFDLSTSGAKSGHRLEYELVPLLNGRWAGQGTGGSVDRRRVHANNATFPSPLSWTVGWNTGFTINNIIPGSPPLGASSIVPNNGIIKFTPNTKGYYTITVQCKEFDGSTLVGLVRRDFTFAVKDCTPPPPKPIITNILPATAASNHATNVNFCAGGGIELETPANPLYNYQWKLNGVAIAGATTNQFFVKNIGNYTVEVSLKSGCNLSKESDITNAALGVTSGETLKLNTPNGKTACANPPIIVPLIASILSAPAGATYNYTWKREDVTTGVITILPNGPTPFTIAADQTGRYSVTAKNTASQCTFRDSVSIKINPLPTVTISSVGNKFGACENTPINLQSSITTATSYVWKKDGVVFPNSTTDKLEIKNQFGIHAYDLSIKDLNGCEATSNTLDITNSQADAVISTPIPAVCSGSGTTPIDLTTYFLPAGGIISGTNVSNNKFDPKTATFGTYTIKYDYVNATGCPSPTKTQTLEVSASPRLVMGPTLQIFKGETVQLRSDASPGVTYLWTGTNGGAFLDPPTIANPRVNPTETTFYELLVKLPSGCSAKGTDTVYVNVPIKVYNTFTPNTDNKNDTWEIDGINSYDKAEVTIYNRWGNEVHYAQPYRLNPFSGIKNGERIASGTYYYVIKFNQRGIPELTGYVTIVR